VICNVLRATIYYNAMIDKYITHDVLVNNDIVVIKDDFSNFDGIDSKESLALYRTDKMFIIPKIVDEIDSDKLNATLFSTPDLYHLIKGSAIFPDYNEYFEYNLHKRNHKNVISFQPHILNSQEINVIKKVFKEYIHLYQFTENVHIEQFFWEIWIMILKLQIVGDDTEITINYEQDQIYIGTFVVDQLKINEFEKLIVPLHVIECNHKGLFY